MSPPIPCKKIGKAMHESSHTLSLVHPRAVNVNEQRHPKARMLETCGSSATVKGGSVPDV